MGWSSVGWQPPSSAAWRPDAAWLDGQVDRGDRRRLRLCVEEVATGEAKRAGDQDVREHLQRGVVLEHAGVVVLPREADLVLGRGQLLLEVEHVLVRLQIRVVLDDGEQRSQGRGERVLRGGLLCRT